MKIYQVGGSVRDQLLGREAKDRDFVVVGATEEEMIALGYEKVGASFPVFLKNGEEYALARTERKIGAGYHGFEVVFDPSVTLEDDLIRRDLTINAMAIDPETGELIDPWGGQHDLAQGILRATSSAFKEDPVRVLRTARFAARYGFKVTGGTLLLMKEIVHELEHVPKERIWAEFEKGLMEDHPARMFEVLEQCGALEEPVLRPYAGSDWPALKNVSARDPIETRFVVIAGQFKEDDYDEYRIPSHLSRVARAFNVADHRLLNYDTMRKDVRLELLKDLRAINNHSTLNTCIQALYILWPSSKRNIDKAVRKVNEDLVALRGIDNRAIIAQTKDPKTAIQEAQLNAMS